MNPDVATAVRALEAQQLLEPGTARHLLRLAEGKWVSVHHELRLLLYAGVALVTAGVSVLVSQNLERIGPLAIATGIGVVAAASFGWVFRSAPPFSWGESASTHVAFDYVLLLAVLLTSADVAYVEAQFTPLGANWPWHLLMMSAFMAAVSLRFDSRIVFSLALSTFAAWRGVSLSFLEGGFWSNFETATRLNTAVVGLVFAGLGVGLVRYQKKPHFEPVATYLGWMLVLLSLGSGSISDEPSFGAYTAFLFLTSTGLAVHSFRGRRFLLFAMGAAFAYAATSRWAVSVLDDDLVILLWFFATSIGSIFLLLRTHRTLERRT